MSAMYLWKLLLCRWLGHAVRHTDSWDYCARCERVITTHPTERK